jgi:signal transduction histidine kinase
VTTLVRWRRRTRRELLADGLVLGGLVAFVVLVYAVVVLGGGALVGRTASPSLVLSVLATAVVALAFDPVQTRLEQFVNGAVLGDQLPPYEVLRRFTGAVAGNAPSEELPDRMARLLADGTCAQSAEVWVAVADRAVLAATWPPRSGEVGAEQGGTRRRDVRHGGELLGVLVVRERPGIPLTEVEERLFADLADQAGLVLRGARLRAELRLRAEELSIRAEELRRSRERLVDAHDAERRRLERDIHDGAQQHLVALAVNLRLADTLARTAPERAADLLVAQEAAVADAVEALAQLSRGIYPPLLVQDGVEAALKAAVAGSDGIRVEATGVGRYPATVEAAAYFCCLEALQNAAKHAGATTVRVQLVGEPAALVATVVDDGIGFDTTAVRSGTGLSSMRDRVESLGGSLTARSEPGLGTTIRAVIPTGSA